MRRFRLTVLLAFLSTVSLSAQTVDDIIAKSFTAIGGVAKLKAIQTVRVTGNFEAGGMQAGADAADGRERIESNREEDQEAERQIDRAAASPIPEQVESQDPTTDGKQD